MTRVLIVDDKADNLYYLSALLGANGCEVRQAHDGAEALQMARAAPPELVISDLLMPVMDGYTLLSQWKADEVLKRVPFIVYTATYTAPEDEELAVKLGADAFILKPSEPSDFIERVRAVQAATARGVRVVPRAPLADEPLLLREYNETLVRKLEDKTVQLEETNRALQRDIAARELVEAALRGSEASFRLLTDVMPQLVWIMRGDGWPLFFNQRWVDYTGLSLAEPASPSPARGALALATHGHADSSAASPSSDSASPSPARGALALATHGHADSSAASPSSDSASPSPARGALALATHGHADSSAASPSSDSASPSPARGALALATHGHADSSAASPSSDSEGRGWAAPIHPEDRSRAEAAWNEAAGGRATLSLEARLRRHDGVYRWWLIRGLPLCDSTGAVEKWFGTCTDIDELKVAQARLHNSEELLRQAQKMEAIGRLAGGVAHDFNNLLSVILSYTTLLLEDLPANEPMRDDLEEIHRAGERATDLTRQLLALSRQQLLQPRVIELGAVVRGMEKMLRRVLSADIAVSMVISPEAGNVVADPGQVEQIIMNLAVNARDAMPRGGALSLETANVELDASYTAEHPDVTPGRYVMLAVSDTGSGMDVATRARVFEPFFTTKAVGKGTGLGLATVFGVVKQSAGHVYVYSEPGLGTTFKIYFPLTDRRVDTEVATAAREPDSLEGTETILLVEDDRQVRVLSGEILRRNGYRVIECQDGREALRASEQHDGRIDLLLTDVVMPGISGRELAERLAQSRPDMRALYVSGYTEDAVVQRGMLDPGIAFLTKPITPQGLLRKVREVIAGQ